MTLYVEHDYVSGGTERFTWHIGEPLSRLFAAARKATLVEADGDELALILERIHGLPIVDARGFSIRWFGDHARFIVGNMSVLPAADPRSPAAQPHLKESRRRLTDAELLERHGRLID